MFHLRDTEREREIASLREKLQKAEERRNELDKTLRALVTKLVTVEASDAWRSVWGCYEIHGFHWTGDNWMREEFQALAVLGLDRLVMLGLADPPARDSGASGPGEEKGEGR